MVEEGLAILAAYGLGIGLVHLFRWRFHWWRQETSHAVIITHNVGQTVEWHLRMFALAQWLQGRHTKITVLDEGSSDETVRIVERMIGRLQANWELVNAGSPSAAEHWLMRQEGSIDEVLTFRGNPLAEGTGTAI